MRNRFSRLLAVVLAIAVLASLVVPAAAATYRPGAQSGPSTSYKNGCYYNNFTRVPITGDGRTDVLAIALSQLGYQEGAANGSFSGEVSGRNNYVEFSYNLGEFGLGYGGSDFPWCASFVSWCLYQSRNTDQNTWRDLGRYHVGDYEYIWKEISCSQWVRQLKGAGYYKYSKYEGGSYTPKYGDLVFFQNSNGVAHIGICVYVSGGRIYTVEGNTSDSSGLEANGGGVYFKNYSLSTSYINGYGVLPYKTNASVSKIDYSGSNPTPGLYIANATKYIYSSETGSSYSWIMDRFTMFEVTQVCSNGRLKVVAKEQGGSTVTGYISNNADRVIQLSTNATDAVDTARTNLQTVIKSVQNIRHYDYAEAKITEIRAAYTDAVALVANTAATETQLNTAANTLRSLMGQTGSNTIALENQGIYINGRNKVISAGDCFIFSPSWNDGLITVDNANIRYTLNVVCGWDENRQINVVKSISQGIGNSTPSIQLGKAEFLIACHDWETGIAAGDDPVEYSGTNYQILSSLSVGDGVKLSGATALNAGTDVEPAAYLKFLPVESAHVSGENIRVGNGQTVLFTPDFNQGLLTPENANIHNTLNLLVQWDDARSSWVVAEKFAGNGATDESSNVEITDGKVLIACHVGDTAAMNFNWNALNAAKVGQKVIFSGVSPTDGAVKLSMASYVRFEDLAQDDTPEEVAPENLALNKDYTAIDPGAAAHIANLTDGQYVSELNTTGKWFGFACAGSNKNVNELGEGTVTIDLGGRFALDSVRAHVFTGANEASILPPSYINVYTSINGVDFKYLTSLNTTVTATPACWMEASGLTGNARYVRFVVGPSGNSTWVFLNELEVYGTEMTGEENIALNTTVQDPGAAGHTAGLVDGLVGESYDDGFWYGIDTSNGIGTVTVDLCDRYQITGINAHVFAGSELAAPSVISVSVSSDGINYIKIGNFPLTADAAAPYWTSLSEDLVVGRYVKLETQSEASLVLLSELEVRGKPYVQSADSNVSMGKDTIFTYYAGSPFTALLNDGLASEVFQYNVNNSSWFAFQNSGDSTIDNVTVHNATTGEARGIVTIDLGGQAEITDVSVHLWAGANDAGAIQPRYINVYYSVDGASFAYMGYVPLDSTKTGAYWAKLDISDSPITAGYVKLALGTMPGDLVLLNEVKVGGLMVSLSEPNEPGSLSNVVLSGEFNKWNPTPNMMNLDDTKVTTNITLEPGSYEFKIFYNNEWFGNPGVIYDSTGDTPWVMDNTANNCTITASRSGQYCFTYDRETNELSVSYIPDTLYLRGSFNDWGTTIVMNADANGTYSATVTLEKGTYEYKIANSDYFVQWPKNNATLELAGKSEVTFKLDFHTGQVTTEVTALEESVVVPTLNLDHPSLSFEGEIMYNLYFTADDVTSVVEMGLIAFSTKNTEGTIENAENVYPGYIEAGGMYMSQTAGVPARYLGDAVYFKAYAKLSDGSYVYSGMAGYNAAVYAKSILKNSTNDYMKRLVVAMINYGAEAQAYFCTKEGVEYTPMNDFLTADQQALINAYDASMVADLIAVDSNKATLFTYNTGDFAKRTNSVSFDGAFAINYYFTAKGTPDNGMKFYYWNTADYEAADVLTPENATGTMDMVAVSGNQYWSQVSGIAAKEVDQTYFVAGVYELDGVTYTTGILAYSLGKYCAKLAAGTTEQQALSAATAVYGYYAKEYFTNVT